LRERGVQPDTLVGVALERGFDLITAYLAILKAGAAFAPLDPAYPRARLLTMFERAGAPFVIATDQMARDLELGERAVQVDDLRASRGRARARTVPTSAAAYGIFTSGSTGEPNCVIVPHAAIVNTLTWRQRWMPLGRGDRVLQTMSPSFDASVWEFFAPLAAGASLVLSLPDGIEGRPLMARQIADAQTADVHATPSWLGVLLDDPALAEARSLRRIICGAEPLPQALQQRVLETPGRALYNLYGPTEAAVDVTAHVCTSDDRSTYAPIGRPIDGVRAL